ncbi:hypothetical protein ACW0JT_03405 [Arthrobacter sp. SA17]
MLREDDHQSDFAPTGVVLAQAALPDETPAVWLVHRDRALPLAGWAEQWPCARFASITGLIREWANHRAGLRRLTELPQTALAIASDGFPVAALLLEAPLQPAQLFCTIGNYQKQVIEAAIDAGEAAGADRLRAATAQALIQRRRDGAPTSV